MSVNQPPVSPIADVAPTRKGGDSSGFSRVQGFLRHFGYLHSRRKFSIGKLDAETSEALRKYQQFHSLPVSGDFDTATKEQMMKPRCGLPDLEDGEKCDVKCRWGVAGDIQLTYAFEFLAYPYPGLPPPGLDIEAWWNAVEAAFKTWEWTGGPGNPLVDTVSFSQATTLTELNNCDIAIGSRLGVASDEDQHFNGNPAVIAHSEYPPNCPWMTYGRPRPLHFNGAYQWSIGAESNAYDVESVALHEIGHLLGLEHSEDNSAVMYAYTDPNSTKRELTDDDRLGYCILYNKDGLVGPV